MSRSPSSIERSGSPPPLDRPPGDSILVSLSEVPAATGDGVGLKAARLARLRAAGLPVPDGFCVTAAAYRAHLAAGDLESTARRLIGAAPSESRRLAVKVRLGLLQVPLEAALTEALVTAYRRLTPSGQLLAVRSSALCEDSASASFAGQFETILGVASEADLVTAVRACWASSWSTRALEYMRAHGRNPADAAMGVLIQPVVSARAAGGGLSRAAEGRMLVTAAWGLGTTVAHGEVVPDRYVLRRDGGPEAAEPGHKPQRAACSGEVGLEWQPVDPEMVGRLCLTDLEVASLGRMMLEVERILSGPVEIEWALDTAALWLLQARPLARLRRSPGPGPTLGDAALRGQPAAAGRATGPATIVDCEADLARVRHGDVLVTRVPGPALATVLPRVVAVVAELGGSTSHLAALARERGIPAVLGVAGATQRIPEGARLAVDGAIGVVRWAPEGSRRATAATVPRRLGTNPRRTRASS